MNLFAINLKISFNGALKSKLGVTGSEVWGKKCLASVNCHLIIKY
jgi:hypothetical protein